MSGASRRQYARTTRSMLREPPAMVEGSEEPSVPFAKAAPARRQAAKPKKQPPRVRNSIPKQAEEIDDPQDEQELAMEQEERKESPHRPTKRARTTGKRKHSEETQPEDAPAQVAPAQTQADEDGDNVNEADFESILEVLERYRQVLGGEKSFQGANRPALKGKKITRRDFCKLYTDWEHIYLQVLGFRRIWELQAELLAANNFLFFLQNPAAQLLERECGMTFHGDRGPASNTLLRSCPSALVSAFRHARQQAEACDTQQARDQAFLDFFRNAFDREADPCLEGRTSRLIQWLADKAMQAEAGSLAGATFGDLTADLKPEWSALQTLWEHLRVFVNRQMDRWAHQHGMSYQQAQCLPLMPPDFYHLVTREAFLDWLVEQAVLVEPHRPPDQKRQKQVVAIAAAAEQVPSPAGGPFQLSRAQAQELCAEIDYFADLEDEAMEVLARQV